MGGPHQMTPTTEKSVYLTMGRTQSLGLPRRCATTHQALSLAWRLLRDLSAVVHPLPLAVHHAGEECSTSRPREAMIEPDGIRDDLGWKAVPSISRVWGIPVTTLPITSSS